MKLKHTYNNMSRNLGKSILFLFIVSIVSLGILKTSAQFKYATKEFGEMKEILNDRRYKVQAINIKSIFEKKYSEKKVEDIINKLEKEYNFYYFTKQPMYLKAFKGSETLGLEYVDFENAKFLVDSVYSVNKKFIVDNEIEVVKGRLFNDRELSIDNKPDINNIPILMGDNYMDYYDIGDKVNISNPKENIVGEIIGFIKEDTIISDCTRMLLEGNISIDNVILTTYSLSQSTSEIIKNIFMGNGIISIDKDIEMSEVNKDLDELKFDILNNLDEKVGFPSINQPFNEEYNYRMSIITIRIISTISIIVLGVVTLTIISLMATNKRKKEFAIHILSGSTKVDLYKAIIIEQFILTIIPYISVFLYFKLVKKLMIDNSIVLISLIVLIISIGIVSFINIKKIYNTSISALVKGED